MFLQVKMIIIRSLNKKENLYGNILEYLENKLGKIKDIIIIMKKRIKSLIDLFYIEIKTNENKKFENKSFSFIQDDCEEGSKLIDKILFGDILTSLDKYIKLLIYVIYNVSKDIKLDEESKFNEASNEIYGETNQIIDTSLQSRFLMEGPQTNIKKTFEYADTNQKVILNSYFRIDLNS